MHVEEEIEVAHPRVTLEVRPNPKQGHHCLRIGRVLEVREKSVVLEEEFVPPVLVCHAHPVAVGWIERVIADGDAARDAGALRRRPDLGRRAAGLRLSPAAALEPGDQRPPAHGALALNVHPEDLYRTLLALAGELATFSPTRMARAYPPYDHDMLSETFEPLLSDIQYFLSLDLGRAIRLDLVRRAPNAFTAAVNDRALFRTATFVLDVASGRPLRDIQMQFPVQCKIGPNTRMKDIVNTHLPGIELVNTPTPPRQIRAMMGHVYFVLDKASPLWPEFSTAASFGIHLSDDWPDLTLDLWAIVEGQR